MPNKIVIAFEGMDGAGKSSLAMFTRKLCEEHVQRYTLIGRRENYANALVGRFTRLLAQEATTLSPAAETMTRMAREYERATLAAAAPAGIVVLDRFVLSCLALARFHGQDVEPLTRMLKDITSRAHLYATVFVRCPFETARERVKERSQALGLRKVRDDRFLRRLGELMEDDFARGVLTGQQWMVENTEAIEAGQEQLMNYLTPYLQKGRTRAAHPLEGTGEETVVIQTSSSLAPGGE